jgi:hypothetical protein
VPFLSINGVTLRIAVDSVSMSYVEVGGEAARSPAGELVGGPSTTKREWRMTTTPVPVSEVDAWVGLIEGKGHVFPLDDDFYSSRGRGPSSISGVPLPNLHGFDTKWGSGRLSAPSDSSVHWAIGLGSTWTLFGWTSGYYAGTSWTHSIIRSDGGLWLDGTYVPPAFGVGEFFVAGGDFVVVGADGSDWYFDDVVALPYAVPDAWSAGMYGRHGANAWSALPRVLAEGTFAPSPVTVRGRVTDSKAVRFFSGGALTTGYALEFTLREV